MAKKIQIRRTKTMQQTIDASETITGERLGRTRGDTHRQSLVSTTPARKQAAGKLVKQIKKAPPKAKPVARTPSPPKVVPPAKAKVTALVKKSALKKQVGKVKPGSTKGRKSARAAEVVTAPVEKVASRRGSIKPAIEEEIPAANEVRRTASKAEAQVLQQTKNAPRRTDSKATAGIVDVVFCLDTTSSMAAYINQAKETVKAIVRNIKDKSQSEDISVLFGVVCYRDHPPQDNTYVTRLQDLCSDKEAIDFISKQSAQGGGDYPEAVLDGLFVAAKNITWRDSHKVPTLRYIFHIADAPPHGKEFIGNSFWPNGVPSGITLDKVVHQINIKEIHYRLINLREPELKKMATLFKEKFTNYDETTLDNASQLNIKVSDMIIRELLPDMDYGDA